MNRERLLGSDTKLGPVLGKYFDYLISNMGCFCSVYDIARNIVYSQNSSQNILLTDHDKYLVTNQIKNCRKILSGINSGFSIYNLEYYSYYLMCESLPIGTKVPLPFAKEKMDENV